MTPARCVKGISEREQRIDFVELTKPVPLADLLVNLEQHERELEECQTSSSIESKALEVRRRQRHIQDLRSAIEARKPSNDVLLSQHGTVRHPMEMLRDEYKGMKLGHIAARVLEERQVPLTTTELSRIIYETKSDDEFSRARNSLSAELRAGAKGECPRWRKLGRYAYASL